MPTSTTQALAAKVVLVLGVLAVYLVGAFLVSTGLLWTVITEPWSHLGGALAWGGLVGIWAAIGGLSVGTLVAGRRSAAVGVGSLVAVLTGLLGLNASRPGFGDATLLIAPVDDENYHPSDGLPPGAITVGVDENVTLTVEGPTAGNWTAIIWPNGLLVNQAYPLTVHMEGNGAGPAEPLEFQIPDLLGRACEENGAARAPSSTPVPPVG